MRLLLLFLVSLLLGSEAAYQIPGWQQHYLIPGDARTLTAGSGGLDITIEDRANLTKYFIIGADEARRLFAAGTASASPGLAVRASSADGHGGQVSWTTSSGRHSSTHYAPGLHLDLHVTVEALDQAPASGEVTWSSPPLQELTQNGNVEVRNGSARWENDHFLLAHLPLFPDAAARKQALVAGSMQGGLPLSLAALVTLVSIFLLRSPPGETEVTTSDEIVLFPRRFYGACLNFSIWAGILVAIPALFATFTLFDRNLADPAESINTAFGLGLMALPLLALIGWLTVRPLREVEANPDGIIVRTGPFRRATFQAPWSELEQARAMTRYYKGRVSDEWVDLRTLAGQKIRIGRNHVREFPRLRDFLVKRTSPAAS